MVINTKCNSLVFVLVLLIYVIFGGICYVNLEHEHEAEHLEDIIKLRRDIKEILLSPRKTNSSYNYELAERTGVVKRLSLVCGGQDLLSDDSFIYKPNKWNFYNAVFFSVTVVTTIGYGNFTPATPWGKFFTVIYALIGIPLCLIITKIVTDIFVKKVKKMHRKFKSDKQKQVIRRKIQFIKDFLFLISLGFIAFVFIPSAIFSIVENWFFLDAVYFSFVSLMTIGLGDFVPGMNDGTSVMQWVYKMFIITWIIVGLGYLMMILSYISDKIIEKEVHRVIRKVSRKIIWRDMLDEDLKAKKRSEKLRSAIKNVMSKLEPVLVPQKHQESSEKHNFVFNRNDKSYSTLPPKWFAKIDQKIDVKSRRHSDSDLAHAEKQLETKFNFLEIMKVLIEQEKELNLTSNDQAGYDNEGFYEIIDEFEEIDQDSDSESKKSSNEFRRRVPRLSFENNENVEIQPNGHVNSDGNDDLEKIIVVQNSPNTIGRKISEVFKKISSASKPSSSRKSSRNEAASRKPSSLHIGEYTSLNVSPRLSEQRKVSRKVSSNKYGGATNLGPFSEDSEIEIITEDKNDIILSQLNLRSANSPFDFLDESDINVIISLEKDRRKRSYNHSHDHCTRSNKRQSISTQEKVEIHSEPQTQDSQENLTQKVRKRSRKYGVFNPEFSLELSANAK